MIRQGGSYFSSVEQSVRGGSPSVEGGGCSGRRLRLALWLVGRNLKIEPILLLSGRGE